MLKKNTIILFFIFTMLFCNNKNNYDSVSDNIKTYSLLLPNRDLLSKERILRSELNNIQITYTSGKENNYSLHINKNEVNEKIFNLELFINTFHMDMKDAVRHHQMYNQQFFLIYHNQNGYFPILGNEYYLVNESESTIHQLIADEQVHEFSKIDEQNYKKIVHDLCKYKNKTYTIPHEMCK